MTQDPSPRHALVTGGARNIGLGIARRLREDGWRTLAALSADEDARALGCTHRLEDDGVTAL